MQYLLSILTLIVLCSACGNGIKKDNLSSNLTRSATTKEQNTSFIKVTINNLRIRSTPDLEGAVIERLKEKAILEYLDDSTTFTTEVKMNGRLYQEHWYLVKSESGNSGWIYGGCIDFLPDAENKRIMALKADIEAQIKANGGKPLTGRTAVVEEAPKIDDYALGRFKTLLNQLNPADIAAMPRAFAYFESVFYKTDDPTADEAFGEVLSFHRKVVNHWKTKVNTASYQHLAVEIQRYGSANMQTDELTRKLEANGLTFGVNTKGTLYLKDNVDFIMRRYYRLISTSMREYLEQYAIENEHPVFEQDHIVLLPTELAAYTVFWDKFLTKHPFFALKSQIQEKRKIYARTLLEGSLDKQVFNPKTKVLQRDFQEAYKVMTTQMGHSPLIKSMKEYQQILEDNSFTRSEKVDEFAASILEKL